MKVPAGTPAAALATFLRAACRQRGRGRTDQRSITNAVVSHRRRQLSRAAERVAGHGGGAAGRG